jgi:segregation and condensation protein B
MAEAAPFSPSIAPEPTDIVEALLFASDGPLEPDRIRDVLGLADLAEAHAVVGQLRQRYEASSRALAISEVGGGYRMVTRPVMATWLVRLARAKTKARLSRAALEALAIVGYKQPVSRPEVDAIRGVNSEGVLDSLLERGLVRIAGRKDAPGRPFLYETTREFLIAFGLRDVADLPKVDGELKVPVVDGADAAGTDAPEGEHEASVASSVDGEETTDGAPSAEPLTGEASTAESGTAQANGDASTATVDSAPDDATRPGESTENRDNGGPPVEALAEFRETAHDAPEHAEGQAQQDPGASGSQLAPGR